MLVLPVLLIGLVLLLGSVRPLPVKASEAEKVRVGWFYQPGYQEMDESDQPCGYNYEYLMRIAQITGWKYDFVRIDNFSACYKMLENGELDLMGCIIYTPERAQTLGLPRSNSGTAYTSLFVRKERELAPYDFKAFDGMRVACRESQNPKDLLEYAKENNFTVELMYCDNVSQIEDAVEKGEADAGLLGGYQSTPTTRIVASFAPTPIYFATTKGNTEMERQLNKALDAIQIENPFYEKELSYKYLPEVKDSFRLTEEERNYVASRPSLRVSYKADWEPFESAENETGAFTGIGADVFRRIGELTGLTFSYIEGFTADAELFSSFVSDFSTANAAGYSLTDSYLTIPLTAVQKVSQRTKAEVVMAVSSIYSHWQGAGELHGIKSVSYESEEECLDAVLKGEAGQALISSYTVDGLLSKTKYRSLRPSSPYGVDCSFSIAVRGDLDPRLLSILNKALDEIVGSEINTIILKNTVKPMKVTLGNFMEQLPADVILVTVLVLLLIAVVLGWLLFERILYARRIRKLLYLDDLTGLYSAKGFEYETRKLLRENPDQPYFILDFDINGFEEYNSINGYAAGDALLKSIAAFQRKHRQKGEACCRIQADHFAALCSAQNREAFARILQEADRTFRGESKNQALLISYGIYEITDRGMSISAMRDCALQAKRTVKGNYERNFSFYDEALHKRQLEDAALAARFEEALQAGELTVYYQPQYDAQTERIEGAEALVRWIPPEGGMIPPNRFIGLLERNALIGKLDLFMFEKVCQKVSERALCGKPLFPISVNLSRVHVYDRQLVSKLIGIVEKHKTPVNYIEIELTETAFLDNQHEIIRVMEELHDAGFLVAIDDFGSGYSSLNMLKDVRFDEIKLDCGFLSNTGRTARGDTVIRHVLALAGDLQARTIAEGVETREQFEFVRDNGCSTVQGYYFSKPVPEIEFDRLTEESFR